MRGNMADDPTIRGLRDAVEAAPEDVDLRLMLAQRLAASGDPQEALEHARLVLTNDPANVTALRVAASAADLSNMRDAAVGYRRIIASLGADEDSAELSTAALEELADIPAPPEPAPATGEGTVDPNDPVAGYLEAPGVTLADVAGLEAVKRRLNENFLGPLKHPELRAAFGASLRGGLLLYGPPGCGKTFVARALAGELAAGFITIGINDVLDPMLGEAERRMHELFELGRRTAPCVIFIDEVDALGQKRSLLRGSAGRNVVNQLLAEMDSIDSDNEGLFVLAATNHPWDVDTALRRPGRLDRTLLVLPPDEVARAAILQLHLKGKPTEDLDIRSIASLTDGYSGADLRHLCESAAQLALARSMESGRVQPISKKDMRQAMKDVRPSTGAWLDMARNYALYANEAGEYDELAAYLRARKVL